MSANEIKCPKCGTNIPITEVLSHRLEEQVKEKVEKRLNDEKKIILEQYEAEQALNIKKLEQELSLNKTKLQEAEKKELDSLKLKNELEEKLKKQDLIIARKIEEEKALIAEKIRTEEQEKINLKLLEKDKQLEDTKKALAEAQRKAHQGSMQTQGEVLELSLEELLKEKFPTDSIEPVPKGVTGADITHQIIDKYGNACGIIAWEAKHTPNWTEEWVEKLKNDGQNIKANICVLVSSVLPKTISHFGIYKGIWVCDFQSIIGLTMALRNQLIAVAKSVAAQGGKEEKKDILYNYLCSQTFANRIESIVETFINMKTSIEKEKIAMTRIWSSREAQITRLTDNTTKMFGDIQGIVGINLPTVEVLELESIAKLEEPKKQKKEKEKTEDSDQFNLFK